MVELPLPRSHLFLWLAMPLVLLAGHESAAHLTRARALRFALAPSLAVAGWLLAIQVIGAPSRSFVVGLACGTIAIAAAGVALRARPARPALGMGLNSVRHVRNDESLKLGTVALIAMAVAASALVAAILRSARARSGARRAGFLALATVALFGVMAGGVVHASMFFSGGADRYFAHSVPQMAPDDARAASFLRSRVAAGEMIYRREGPAVGYARWAGLPVPWSDWATSAYGFSPERIRARAELLKELPGEPAPYLHEGMVWFVLDERDARLGGVTGDWIAKGVATKVATFGALGITRLDAHCASVDMQRGSECARPAARTMKPALAKPGADPRSSRLRSGRAERHLFSQGRVSCKLQRKEFKEKPPMSRHTARLTLAFCAFSLTACAHTAQDEARLKACTDKQEEMARTLERVASDVAELKKSHEELASTVKSLKSRAGDGGAYRPTNPDLEAIYLVPVGDGAVRGPAGAKITIVEYADFQCPFCARVAGTLRNLEHQYPNEIRLVYKHQPLPFHQNAKAAAKAAEAAGQQGRFWQMWDVLFEHSGELGPDKLENFASELQLDVNKFRAAMQDPAVAAKIEAQSAEANRLGAMGTPSFFINGRYLAGAQPLESFEAAVDRELKRADQLLASGVKREDLYEKLVAGGRTNR